MSKRVQFSLWSVRSSSSGLSISSCCQYAAIMKKWRSVRAASAISSALTHVTDVELAMVRCDIQILSGAEQQLEWANMSPEFALPPAKPSSSLSSTVKSECWVGSAAARDVEKIVFLPRLSCHHRPQAVSSPFPKDVTTKTQKPDT